ncbi:PDDEXK nuclease domain-containing protein [Nostoc sp.]|uniref:PDDEXK nuclease domain-containing protein n=1 Tax=Nostoc sp. TaxID=1180 RepID=UPI002FF3EC2A
MLNRQQQQGWGAKVINRLAADLQKAFPEMKGFSLRNLKYMRAFAEAYPDEELVQQVVALIPWGHTVRILDIAFVGSQYHLEVGGEDFYINLLFYHLRLRCYVVIDLKIEEFKPEYSGKMNFYVSAVDELLRHPDDQPTIGMIICKSKNKVIAEYSLRDIHKPIGVSVYQLKDILPDALQGNLPTIEQLEAELKTITKIELGLGLGAKF